MTGKLLFTGLGLALLVFGFKNLKSVNQRSQASIEKHRVYDSDTITDIQDPSILDQSNESREELNYSSQIEESDLLEEVGDTELKNQVSHSHLSDDSKFNQKQTEEIIQNLNIDDFENADHYEIIVEMLRDGSIDLHQIEKAKNFVAHLVMESEAELTEDLNEYNYEY